MSIYPSNSETSKVLLFVEDFHSYHLEQIRSGIQNYFDRAERTLSYVQVNITELARFFGDSILDQVVIIGILRSDELQSCFEEMNIPCLNLVEKDIPSKTGLDLAFEGEGTMAADYFINDLKVEHLGFIGNLSEKGHHRRYQEFKTTATKRKLTVKQCSLAPRKGRPLVAYLKDAFTSHDDSMRKFLMGLKKPAGIFCANDRLAFDCYFNCKALGIAVPNQIAILGVGSHSQTKAAWTHFVSVVELDHHRFGYTAAKLMNDFVTTGKISKPVRLSPSGIHHNQTTVHKKVTDPLMQKALTIIIENPELSVKEIAVKLNLTRAVFDKHFYNATNTTVSRMIEQERFRRAKQLLRNHKYSMESIAGLAGYPSRRSMRRSFQRFMKMSPQKFREWESRETSNKPKE